MKTLDLKRYLRQNKDRKNGLPGSYSIRILWLYDKRKKPRRIERGLGTNIDSEAIARASVLLRFIYSLGHQVSNRIHVSIPGCKPVPIHKAIPCSESTVSDMPLFANLSPFSSVDKHSGCS